MNNGNWYPNGYGGFGNDGDRMRYGQTQYWNGQNAGQQPQPTQPIGLYDVVGQRTRVDWVQGEYAAKSYAPPPGMSVILFDLERPNRVYVKAVNAAGVPIYTAGFDLAEVKLGQPAASPDDERYVPREEYERSMNQIAQLFANMTEGKENADVRRTETARMGHDAGGAEPARTAAEQERGDPGTGFPGV